MLEYRGLGGMTAPHDPGVRPLLPRLQTRTGSPPAASRPTEQGRLLCIMVTRSNVPQPEDAERDGLHDTSAPGTTGHPHTKADDAESREDLQEESEPSR